MFKITTLHKAGLATLLTEFREKGLDASALKKGYKGMSPNTLKTLCCADGLVSDVDFDLAMRDLEDTAWVKTGPLEAYTNPPGSSVAVLALFSKREYTYLSIEGYKAATKVKPVRMPSAQHIHISGNFHQSPIGVGNNIAQTVKLLAPDAAAFQQLREEIKSKIEDCQKQSDLLARLEALEEAQDKPSRILRYPELVAMLGDHITVLTFLAPLMQRLMQ